MTIERPQGFGQHRGPRSYGEALVCAALGALFMILLIGVIIL